MYLYHIGVYSIYYIYLIRLIHIYYIQESKIVAELCMILKKTSIEINIKHLTLIEMLSVLFIYKYNSIDIKTPEQTYQ